jgi:hypothetical protein
MKKAYMKRGLLLLSAVVVFGLSASSSVFAYDGGSGGFPPGQVGNPNPPHKLVCDFVVKELPNNKSVWLPRCRMVKSTETAALNRSMSARIRELIARMWQGQE